MEKLNTMLQQTLDRFAKLGTPEQVETPEQPPRKAEVIYLPTWKEEQRGVANICLRSALFAAIQGKHRRAMKREIVASQNGFTIRFTGIQLDQSDLEVWEMALHLARQHPLGTRCEFTAHAFLKALGRNTGKSDHEWLKDVFARIAAGLVEIIKGGRETYFGHLIDQGARDEVTGRYVLQLNPGMAALFKVGWTAIDWQQRKQLNRKPLAQWLQGFLATHAEPFPMKVNTLCDLSGSRTQEGRKFKQNLKAALEELKAIGAIISYRFDGDLLHVERVPSASQQRHLARRKKNQG